MGAVGYVEVVSVDIVPSTAGDSLMGCLQDVYTA